MTTIGCPICFLAASANERAIQSVASPAAYGTISSTGRSGYSPHQAETTGSRQPGTVSQTLNPKGFYLISSCLAQVSGGSTVLPCRRKYTPMKLHCANEIFTTAVVPVCFSGQGHLNGDNAPHPIEPGWRTPAALLLLEGRSPPRRRLAGRSQARGLPSSRCPGVRGHTWSRSAQPCQRTPLQPTRARRTAVFRMIRTAPSVIECK